MSASLPWHAGDEPIRRLIELNAAGLAIPEGLRAASLEAAPGRLRESLRSLAGIVEAGAMPPGLERHQLESLVAAAALAPSPESDSTAAEEESSPASRARIGMRLMSFVDDQRTIRGMARRVEASLWLSSLLLLVGGLISTVITLTIQRSMDEMLEEFDMSTSSEYRFFVLCLQVIGPLAMIVATVLVLILLARHMGPLRRAAEACIDRVPIAGGALVAGNLATMCDAISRCLASGATYPTALRAAMPLVASERLRRWLSSTAESVESGGEMSVNLHRLPVAPDVLPALVGPTGPDPERPQVGWGLAARHFRSAAVRGSSFAALLPPMAALAAALVSWASMTAVFAALTIFMSLISSLGG